MLARDAFFGLGLVAATAIFAAAPSRAQCRLCDAPATGPEQPNSDEPIDLRVEAELDFDRLVVISPGDGSATLRPDGTRQVTGTIEALSARAMVGEARVRGEPGRAIRIELPHRITLHSLSGGQISLEDIVTDLPDVPRLDSAGRLSFRFGGKVKVTGDAEGEYRGDLPITAEYL